MLKDEIRDKKDMSFRKMSLPNSQKKELISFVIPNNNLHISSDELTNAIARIALRKNLLGGSTSAPLK